MIKKYLSRLLVGVTALVAVTAAQAGAIDEARVVRESLGSIKRAGADMILTYFAMDLALQGI